jgi:hypothetical protein
MPSARANHAGVFQTASFMLLRRRGRKPRSKGLCECGTFAASQWGHIDTAGNIKIAGVMVENRGHAVLDAVDINPRSESCRFLFREQAVDLPPLPSRMFAKSRGCNPLMDSRGKRTVYLLCVLISPA